MSIVAIALIASIPRNEMNDVFVHYFDETVPFRIDADFMTENLTGLYIIDYSLDSGESGGISNPEYLKDVNAFADWYRKQPETMHVNTITDIMKRLNKNMHGDEQNWYKLPDERNLAAQYLLLYEMSLPYGLDLNNQINVEKSATRFTVTLQTMSTNELLALDKRASDWLENNTTHLSGKEGSGVSMMFAHIGKTQYHQHDHRHHPRIDWYFPYPDLCPAFSQNWSTESDTQPDTRSEWVLVCGDYWSAKSGSVSPLLRV